MIEIVRERLVNAPVTRVWDLIEPVDRLPAWFVGAETAIALGGHGLGRRQRLRGAWGRHRFEIDQTVTHYETGRVLGWRHDAERLDGQPAPRLSRETAFQIGLEAVDQRTRVQLTSRQLPGNLLKGLVIRLVAVPRIARMLERSLDQITMALARGL